MDDVTQIYLIIAVAAAALIVIKIIYDSYRRKKYLIDTIIRGYGALPKNDYSALRYNDNGISHYYKNKEKNTPVIDDITWNDLDMETVYMILNNTSTGIGEEYLYALLHMPCMSAEKLLERDATANYFDTHEKDRIQVQMELLKLGKLKTSSVGQYLSNIRSLRPHNPALHLFSMGLMIVVIIGCILRPVVWLPALFIALIFNIITYFNYKGKISSYFVVFSYLSRMTQTALKIANKGCPGIEAYNKKLKEAARPLNSITKYSWLFVTGTEFSADLLSLILDYVKMLFHFDLIIFDYMVHRLFDHQKELDVIMDTIGELDCDIAIGSYRKYMAKAMGTPVCTPSLHDGGEVAIRTENIYHPMVIHPVTNSLYEHRSVLLTGSNASGKSTFLKTIAINAILAQTIYTCLADRYESPYFRIYSSMALQDNIQGNESYYIVEIKSLKRILDACADEDASQEDFKQFPVLCFIDEVLRGTNTVERIAASSRILYTLAHKNALCFAATHDIELTTILENTYANYHFQEEVSDNDVTFDYVLYKGRAVSRNAIKLLGIIGFSKDIIGEATDAAKAFEEEGSWTAMH